MADLTLADVQEAAPRAELVGDEQPDIKIHDANTFAGLTAQTALKTLYAQGLYPTGDRISDIYGKALADANEYHAHQAEQQEAANIDIAKRFRTLSPQLQKDVSSGKIGLAAAEETTKAEVETQKTQTLEQWKQGPSAVAAAKAQPGGAAAGELTPLDPQQQSKLSAYDEGFYAVQTLKGLFDRMANTATAGGVLKTGFGLTTPITNITSPEVRDYRSYVDSNLVGLAKAVQGDSATGASKDTIQAAMKEALPNELDNVTSGGHKIYRLADMAYHKLLSDRTAAYGHQDTSQMDTVLTNMRTYLDDPNVKKYDVLAPQNQPVVQLGNSDQAKAVVNSVNAAAGAGVNLPGGGLNTASAFGGQSPEQEGPMQLPQQAPASQAAQQATAAKYQQAQQLPGKVASWLGGLLPENWDPSAYQQPRPWETTSQQYVGTGQ